MRPMVMLCVALAACSSPDRTASTQVADTATVEAKLAVEGGQIWYRTTGHGSAIPVILLHGGPGFSSYYLKPFESIGDDRRVVRYDQLGGGKSDVVSDTTLFTIDHFVDELEALRAHLGYDKVHLLGHSWGTILGLEYYRAHRDHVASLILASSALDIPQWERHARELTKTLSDSARRAIRVHEADKQYDAPDYQNALGEFYSMYVWRKPVQADLDSSLASFNQAIYNYMQGPSEFTITGTLKAYDATPFLKNIKVPTLFMVGEFDEADTTTVRKHAGMTPGARYEVIPGAAHMTPWDNPVRAVSVVREFLRTADGGQP